MRLVRFWSSWRGCAVRHAGRVGHLPGMGLFAGISTTEALMACEPGASGAARSGAVAVEPGVCGPETICSVIASERSRRGCFFGSCCGDARLKRPERMPASAFRWIVPTACSSGCALFCRCCAPGSLAGGLLKRSVRGLRCCKRLTICRSFMETPIRSRHSSCRSNPACLPLENDHRTRRS